MKTILGVEQLALRGRDLIRLCGRLKYNQWDFYHMYTTLDLPFGHGYTVAATLGMMLFSEAAKAGMPLDKVQEHASKVIVYGLSMIAADSCAWKASTRESEEDVRLLANAPECLAYTRLAQEALCIHERPGHRFLVLTDGKLVFTAEGISDVFSTSPSATLALVDGQRLVERLRAAYPGPLFTVG